MIYEYDFLSYVINNKTPTYGNRGHFQTIKESSIEDGDVANNTSISTTTHIGTHLDMPYHFYKDGQTIEDFKADFWIYKYENVIFLELESDSKKFIIRDEIIDKLEKIKNNSLYSTSNYQMLIVKTGICFKRNQKEFWEKNYGFHPDIAHYLRKNFPNIRIFGFDSISVSSWQDRKLGRIAHKTFLDTKSPILLLEDMNLCNLNKDTNFKELVIAPFRISASDGIPVTILLKKLKKELP